MPELKIIEKFYPIFDEFGTIFAYSTIVRQNETLNNKI